MAIRQQKRADLQSNNKPAIKGTSALSNKGKFIVLCLAVPGLICLLFLVPSVIFLSKVETVSSGTVENTLAIAILALAASFFIGIQIYNVLSRKDVEELAKANASYKELLISNAKFSKSLFQMSVSNAMEGSIYSEFIISESRIFDDFIEEDPFEANKLLLKLSELEQKFKLCVDTFWEGQSDESREHAEKCMVIANQILNETSGKKFADIRQFLNGYLTFKICDLYFYRSYLRGATKEEYTELKTNGLVSIKSLLGLDLNSFLDLDLNHSSQDEKNTTDKLVKHINHLDKKKRGYVCYVLHLINEYARESGQTSWHNGVFNEIIYEALRKDDFSHPHVSESQMIKDCGVYYQNHGKNQEAKKCYSKSIELNNDAPRNYRVYVAIIMKEFEKHYGHMILNEAMVTPGMFLFNIQPHDFRINENEEGIKEFLSAKDYIDVAIERFPNVEEILLQAARYYTLYALLNGICSYRSYLIRSKILLERVYKVSEQKEQKAEKKIMEDIYYFYYIRTLESLGELSLARKIAEEFKEKYPSNKDYCDGIIKKYDFR